MRAVETGTLPTGFGRRRPGSESRRLFLNVRFDPGSATSGGVIGSRTGRMASGRRPSAAAAISTRVASSRPWGCRRNVMIHMGLRDAVTGFSMRRSGPLARGGNEGTVGIGLSESGRDWR
jgi:hypothetical protein